MGRITCCLCVPVHPAAIVISVLGVLSGGAFGFVYARNIASGEVFTPNANPLVNAIPYVGMGCWMLLALVSLFGVIAAWKQHAKLVSIYFYALFGHFILDLIFLIAGIVIAINDGKVQNEQCIARAAESNFSNGKLLCGAALRITAILFISILSVYKIISAYTTYVIFKYKRYLAKEAHLKAKAAEVEAQQIRDSTWNKSYDANNPPASWSKFDD